MSELSDKNLMAMLEANRLIPERDPQAAARGRTIFLREASELRAGVSPITRKRHRVWSVFTRKDGFAMRALLVLTITFVFLATGGMTVYAAQDDLPNQPLYGVKTWSEDVGLALMDSPSIRMEQLMNLAQRRVNEMAGLATHGESIPATVTARLQQHIENAMQIAARQNDDEMPASLLRIRENLQAQEQELNQIQSQSVQAEEPELIRAREMIREQIRVAENGLTNPQQFRAMHQNQNRLNPTATSSPTLVDTLTPQVTPTPASGQDPWPSVTPNMGTTSMPNGNDGNNPGTTPGNGSGGSNGNGSGGGGGTDGSRQP